MERNEEVWKFRENYSDVVSTLNCPDINNSIRVNGNTTRQAIYAINKMLNGNTVIIHTTTLGTRTKERSILVCVTVQVTNFKFFSADTVQ